VRTVLVFKETQKTMIFLRQLRRFALCLTCVLLGFPAVAATGIRALDNPAITVKAPGQTTMIAVTRAGDRLVAVGVHGVIIYSDDHGASWTQASVPVGVLLTCVGFADPQHGWAAGQFGVILHTADAGATWQVQLNGNQVNQMIADNANAALQANPNSDTAQRAVHRAGFFTAAGPDKPFLSMLVFDANNVEIFGAYRMTVRTNDGGKTWAEESLNIADPLSHNLYGVAAVGPDVFIAGEAGNDYVSTDGAQHFVETTPPSPNDTTMFGALDTGDGGVLLYGVAGEAYTSHDGGKSWATLNIGTTQNLTAAHALSDGDILLASEDGSLYISHDHAKTFSLLPQSLPMAPFDFVQAKNGDVVVAGSSGMMSLPAQDFKN
jgi:photosystem II stability/assembly factor-like uncharacterized protein